MGISEPLETGDVRTNSKATKTASGNRKQIFTAHLKCVLNIFSNVK